MAIRGSCLCGAIAFEMTGAPMLAVHCHCSRCRKVRGTAHATNVATSLDGVRFVRGEDRLVTYRHADAKFFGHTFCRVCGSSMPRRDEARGWTVVPMGSFDDDPGFKPTAHIHVDSKAPWEDIADDLPRHGAGLVVPPPIARSDEGDETS